MLLGMERIRTSRWVGVVVNLCLRGKVGRVGGRTLVMLSIVSPVVALANERLGVAPWFRLVLVLLRALTAT